MRDQDRLFETSSSMSHGLELRGTTEMYYFMHMQTHRFQCISPQFVRCSAFPLANTRPIFNRMQQRIIGDDLLTPSSSLPPHPIPTPSYPSHLMTGGWQRVPTSLTWLPPRPTSTTPVHTPPTTTMPPPRHVCFCATTPGTASSGAPCSPPAPCSPRRSTD